MARTVYSTGPGGKIDVAAPACPRCNDRPCRCPGESLGSTVRIRRLRRGRRGKTVTAAGPLPLDREQAGRLLAQLKRGCGSGGTLRAERSAEGLKRLHLEIQGDHVERLERVLASLGFVVKRSGG